MNYIYTLLEEKNIDPEATVFEFTIEGVYHYMPLAVVLERIGQNKNYIDITSDKLRQIDFQNGKILPFFEYLAKGVAQGSI